MTATDDLLHEANTRITALLATQSAHSDSLNMLQQILTQHFFFFLRKSKLLVTVKATGLTHRQQSQTSAVTGACGLLGPPEEGPVIHYRNTLQAYETIYTIEGERGGVHKKSINAWLSIAGNTR